MELWCNRLFARGHHRGCQCCCRSSNPRSIPRRYLAAPHSACRQLRAELMGALQRATLAFGAGAFVGLDFPVVVCLCRRLQSEWTSSSKIVYSTFEIRAVISARLLGSHPRSKVGGETEHQFMLPEEVERDDCEVGGEIPREPRCLSRRRHVAREVQAPRREFLFGASTSRP